jgi:hypothetical protein
MEDFLLKCLFKCNAVTAKRCINVYGLNIFYRPSSILDSSTELYKAIFVLEIVGNITQF